MAEEIIRINEIPSSLTGLASGYKLAVDKPTDPTSKTLSLDNMFKAGYIERISIGNWDMKVNRYCTVTGLSTTNFQNLLSIVIIDDGGTNFADGQFADNYLKSSTPTIPTLSGESSVDATLRALIIDLYRNIQLRVEYYYSIWGELKLWHNYPLINPSNQFLAGLTTGTGGILNLPNGIDAAGALTGFRTGYNGGTRGYIYYMKTIA
jgi:hypothetical protein